ncbi:S1C family serine protease [Oceanobacillus bengalensis]|uniref:Serine protease n=1 Tax=Oceanobacillus bengalensis TaxID=1435466 RepID=A0A494Z6W4_9BACI|nr:S1C family serine protease [Oceanobacillus bengalensis]RKQ18234.1 serine protease [Oceanobacillus bengalensis]
MIEQWLVEVGKGIGRLFLNPLVYWAIFLVLFAGLKRIKKERQDFGSKVFDIFSEWKHTWGISLIAGLLISVVSLASGMVFTYETFILLSVVIILLSLTLNFSTLSAAYTIGITYLLLLVLPLLMGNQTILNENLFSKSNFTALSILLGLFLVVESYLIRGTKRNGSFPSLTLSSRGIWIGQHRVKRVAFIPFFTFIPTGMIGPFEPYWPTLSMGEESFSLLLFPFLIGTDFLVRGRLPKLAAKHLANAILLLALFVTVIAFTSMILPWLSVVAILLAIIGKEYIRYRFRVGDLGRTPYFHPENDGLKILSIIPGTTAERLDVFVGETIVKVNGRKINNEDEFYIALHDSGAYFKLDVLDDSSEVRFVQGAMYEGDHHELGFVFADKPYRMDKKKAN